MQFFDPTSFHNLDLYFIQQQFAKLGYIQMLQPACRPVDFLVSYTWSLSVIYMLADCELVMR